MKTADVIASVKCPQSACHAAVGAPCLGLHRVHRVRREAAEARKAAPVERRHGGWFIVDEINGWSGPWKTEAAALAACNGDYDEAHRLERAGQ
jgi:hypothetical protein